MNIKALRNDIAVKRETEKKKKTDAQRYQSNTDPDEMKDDEMKDQLPFGLILMCPVIPLAMKICDLHDDAPGSSNKKG